MISEEPTKRPSASTLINHPCICPDAFKSKAQLRKELNQEKFKNEMLKQKVKIYEEQMVSQQSPFQASSNTANAHQQRVDAAAALQSSSSKFARSRSSTYL